jgi:hypothetical protein
MLAKFSDEIGGKRHGLILTQRPDRLRGLPGRKRFHSNYFALP